MGGRERVEAGGDAWAAAHRDLLGASCWMTDVDVMFGAQVFGMNTGNRLFMEYVPDLTPIDARVRRFALVALFDRKAARLERYMMGEQNARAIAFHLWLCRVHAAAQGIRPRFFTVLGDDTPPWHLIEFDIDTGEECGRSMLRRLDPDEWQVLWDRLGLLSLRNRAVELVTRG